MTVKLRKKQKSLKKELGLLEVFCIASGAMISSGLFILPSIAYAQTGSSVIVSYLIASLLMLPAMLSMAELATAMPKEGGDYFFINRSMGPAIGTVGGLASWFALASKTAFALIGIGAFVQLFNPDITPLTMKLIAVTFCILFVGINLIGVKHAGRIQVILVAGLLSLLLIYVFVGFFHIQPSRFEPFTPHGFGPIFATAGLVFISYLGLTHICSLAEEIKKPKRNIPLGMLLAWTVVSTLYILVILVTVGVLDNTTITSTLMPISRGAEAFLGEIGLIALSAAAILAFITTANGGLLSSSRYPLAMSKDQLIPGFFSKISKRGNPVISILFTSVFMILIILFLDLKDLVETASTLVLLMFILVNLSIIIMREGKLRYYLPSFKSPLYPWIQITGIIGYSVLIVQMGVISLLLLGFFVCLGLVWYWLFARDKVWREYSFIQGVERVSGMKSTGYLFDEELRKILIQRDDINEKRFEKLLRTCEFLEVFKYNRPDNFAWMIANKLADRLDIDKDKLYVLLKKRQDDSNSIVHPGIAIISHIIPGYDKFQILFFRSKDGFLLCDDKNQIHALFIIIASDDLKSYYYQCLMWLVQIAEQPDFKEKWIKETSTEYLREIMLYAWKKRK